MLRILIAGLPGSAANWLAQRLPGVTVEMAFSGQEALDMLRTDGGRLLVLDASVEDPAAAAVVRRIRADERLKDLPVLYTMELDASSVKEADLRRLVTDLHVDELLFQPVDRSELLRAVSRLVQVTPAERPSVPLDSAEGTQERLSHALAQVWKRARGPVLDRIAVLERAAEFVAGDRLTEPMREGARREAHRLAGALGTFGLGQGSVQARELEHILGSPVGRGHAPRMAELAARLKADVLARAAETATPEPAPVVATAPNDPPVLWITTPDEALAEQVSAEVRGRGLRAASDAEMEDGTLRPDAVFLDLRLRGEGEAEWDAFAKAARRAPGVPVLAYTDRDALLDRVRALKMGARTILHPPLAPGFVGESLERMLPVAGAARQTILTVDDDPAVTGGLRAILEPQHFAVHTLNDPLRFWTELRSVKPDLLVLDIDMPHLNGIELCRVVRSDPEWRHVPIVFLTARSDADTIYRVFAAGADDFLNKPVVGPELVSRIRNRLERRPA
ncbi:response regulator [Longimicrobium terrae]|uniref:DNA-binding response OmpR family regulator n=1 Tax=Longimicrobium terrae TaxID=1639882 RepID=A0A841H5E2_9BACT|nr:response regulator [Longimicrobium terrae]MBB4638913.1 DNA-binding response OmpR family regulator [Longimicrobium terrae]MBB6073152.1 DNA-binding response OmpR family regulator [Longimicrobium terrae]NNC30161.1 response regulator [Longimicrobium terrae]